jgi:5-methylcytosine-specific restriction protein A
MSESNLKSQRVTKNLGFNTARTQDESYAEIEAKSPTAKCTDGNHEGDRILPVRNFYLNNGGKGLQGACITCQKNRRANRIKRSREKFEGKTKQEIYEMYTKTYGKDKTCSKCKTAKTPSDFPISISMETGLHNHCITCSIGNSQGNGGLRDFIFLPDKDGIKYKKKEKCERCGGTNKLAVDHILPIAKGGKDCIPNKQTLCVHCNSKKNDTIDCPVKLEFLCDRYKDIPLDFTDNTRLSQVLSKKVYEFRKSHIDDKSLEEIRTSIKDYSKKHNLGHNLDRIVTKISVIFNKC